MQIPCTGHGVTIYPHGGNVLAVEVDGRRNIAKKLAALPGLRLWQEGDRERTWLFDVSLFPQVAAIVQPKRRRQLTPEQREAMRQRLSNYAFRPAQELTKSTLKRARTPQADMFVTQGVTASW